MPLLCWPLMALRACAQSASGPLPPLAPPAPTLPPTFWEQHGTTVTVAGFALLAIAVAVAWLVLHTKPPVPVPPGVLAREALARLRGRPEDGHVLSEISRILRQYLIVVLGLPRQEFTTAEFSGALAGNDKIGVEPAQAVAAFLRECDQRKFSAANAPAPMDAADRALAIVAEMEKQRAGLVVETKADLT
ncbi:MAG TPA: hypothetical protein VL970_00780 [Candidatus Acidoferrales bacterium]|nr:hypothetical protein [Candidatus Acidoferrales bacterium]